MQAYFKQLAFQMEVSQGSLMIERVVVDLLHSHHRITHYRSA